MIHIMTDLETLGTNANSPILSIGALAFSANGIIPQSNFYLEVDHTDAIKRGAVEDADTLKWWSIQSDEARKVLMPGPHKVSTENALIEFSRYIAKYGDVCVWGNGAAFDNAILSNLFTMFNIVQPWMYWNDRCFRTVKSIYPKIQVERKGTHHNALDDAIYQTEYLLALNSLHDFQL